MEKKIYERQVSKQGMSNRVVDVEQTERVFSTKDLDELFIYVVSEKPSLLSSITWLTGSQKPKPPQMSVPDPLNGFDPVMTKLCASFAQYFSEVT